MWDELEFVGKPYLFVPWKACNRDGPHCRTWNPGGGVGFRSNSSHLTYTVPL